MSNFDDVQEFHHKFGVRTNKYDGTGPQHPSSAPPLIISDEEKQYRHIIEFRLKFLKEELQEFEDAYYENELVLPFGDEAKMFDALLDLVYVAMGTASMLGYPWQEGWEAVQEANMRKKRALEDGSDSKRGSQYDIVKPEGWRPPDIDRILELHGFQRVRCPHCKRLYVDAIACKNSEEGYFCEEVGVIYR